MKQPRAAVCVAALAVVGFGCGAGPAFGDDAPPAPLVPPGVSAPTPEVTPSSGPTYVIVPGSPGDDLGAPGAAPADVATPRPGAKARVKPPAATTGAATGAPTAAGGATDSLLDDSRAAAAEATRWKVGAGVFLLLVLSEITRIGFRRQSRSGA